MINKNLLPDNEDGIPAWIYYIYDHLQIGDTFLVRDDKYTRQAGLKRYVKKIMPDVVAYRVKFSKHKHHLGHILTVVKMY